MHDSKLWRADAQIRLLAEQGAAYRVIAEQIGATLCGVRHYCIRVGIQKTPAKCGRPKIDGGPDERAEKMMAMYRQGITLEKIGQQFGVTRERVRQITKKFGAERAGINMRRAVGAGKDLGRAEALRARIYAKWGVPVDLWRELRSNGTIRAFEQQRKSAANRGIGWSLTFAEWFAIWQASGKMHLRGRGKGRYCMSRIRDDGPYTLGNVHVQLSTDNSRDAVKVWKDAAPKEIRGVYCLYPGTDKPWLARAGKVRLGFHETAELAGAARDAYIAANPGTGGTARGKGRGWTFVAKQTNKPYSVVALGKHRGSYATQAEAEAVYRAACEAA